MTLEILTGALPPRHGFFTRNGGVSAGAFASLNCSLSGADDPAFVQANRASVAKAMGVTPANLLGLKQVHGAAVLHVTQAWEAGAGPAADAMFTTTRRIALAVVTADCAPVLFSDAAGTCVGAAHAGWRGALLGVLEATGMAMRSKGAQNLSAIIGPCIQQQSYEVGRDMRDTVLARGFGEAFFTPGGSPEKWQFDLPGYCAARLARIEVPCNILRFDTFSDEQRFFSHRRRTLRGEAALGHQISVIRTL